MSERIRTVRIARRLSMLWLCALLAGSAVAQEPDAGDRDLDGLVERGAAVGVDAALLQELRVRAEESGLTAELTASLLAEPVAAAEAGLPARLLAQKGLEGLAKGVPPERILPVLTELRGNLALASGLVDPWLGDPAAREALAPSVVGGGVATARAALVESAAMALQAGAPLESVRELLERVPAGLRGRQVTPLRLGVGLEVLADIPVAARSPGIAAELVLEALASGFAAAELRELPAALEAASRRGQLPAEAVARGALAQMQGELPAAVVLQNLFQGDLPGSALFELPPGLERAGERAKGRGRPPPDWTLSGLGS